MELKCHFLSAKMSLKQRKGLTKQWLSGSSLKII